MAVYICDNLQNVYLEWVLFTIGKLYLNKEENEEQETAFL